MSELSDGITELIWKAAHNNKKYGLEEAKVLSVTLKVPVHWNIVKSKRSN